MSPPPQRSGPHSQRQTVLGRAWGAPKFQASVNGPEQPPLTQGAKRGLSAADVAAVLAVSVVKATLPLSVGFILLRQWRKWRVGKIRGAADVLRLALRHSLRLWLTLEAYFYLHYKYQHWRLSQVDIHVAPARKRDGIGLGSRRDYLERCLAALDEVSKRQAENMSNNKGSSTWLEDEWPLQSQHTRVMSADALLHRVSSLQGGSAASAEDLVRLGGSEGNFSSWGTDEATLTLSLRRAELSGWFFYTPPEQISRGNVAEWLIEYFFNGMSREVIREDEALSRELDGLIQRIVEWAQLDPESSEDPNPDVRCMRLTRDPLPSGHLPFWLYFLTNIVLPHITRAKLAQLGFRRYRAGSMIYWTRRAAGRARGLSNPEQPGAKAKLPLVFCHGLGVGVLPYVKFVAALCEQLPSTDIFCVDLPHIQMRPREEVPSAREVCACLGDMLEAWGHSSAHFVGHSFGTLLCAWTLRYMPSSVASVSLLDPICLLLCKSDLIHNALYAWKTRSPFEDLPAWLLSLLVFRELYICHTLSRTFFWNQNNLWPEDLCQVPSLVVLSGRDRLVPAHTVKSYLEALCERRRRANEKDMRAAGSLRTIGSIHGLLSHGAGSCYPTGFEPKVRFLADAVHGQFWGDADLMKQVLHDVTSLVDFASAQPAVPASE
mmetsp:Transcript_46676/g.108780  ORF Transcript_46676/g.108780 Transcript_46676/m.108780 type:complete len:660 (+) Transcript_46676:58-2037(+)